MTVSVGNVIYSAQNVLVHSIQIVCHVINKWLSHYRINVYPISVEKARSIQLIWMEKNNVYNVISRKVDALNVKMKKNVSNAVIAIY